MKTILSVTFYFFILLPLSLTGQTAEEIITRTEKVYLDLHNYVDHGVSIHSIYHGMEEHKYVKKYEVAEDDKMNVFHIVFDEKHESLKGFKYSKKSTNTTGTYYRIYADKTDSFDCPLSEATFRLGAVGDGILYMVSTLKYANLYPESKSPGSVLQQYDHVTRLSDTIINGDNCYVLQLLRTIEVTPEMADKLQISADSMHAADYNYYEYPPQEPRTSKSESKYFVNRKNNMIVRREIIYINDDRPNGKSILEMNPEFNVRNFKKYLEEKKI